MEHQPLKAILCHFPEKGRKDTEKLVGDEERKNRDDLSEKAEDLLSRSIQW